MTVPAARDPGPMARLRDLQADPDAMDEVFRQLCDGKSLAQIATAWKLPKHRFSDWMLTDHADVLYRAERGIVHERMMKLMALSENLSAENAAAFKAEADFIFKTASKWHREKYGEHVKVEKGLSVEDATAMLTAAKDLLRDIRRPEPRVIEADEVTQI